MIFEEKDIMQAQPSNYMGNLKDYKNDSIIRFGFNKIIGDYAWYVIGTNIHFYFPYDGAVSIFTTPEDLMNEPDQNYDCFGSAIVDSNVKKENILPFLEVLSKYGLI